MSLKKQLFLVCGAIVMPFLGLHADNVNVALHKPVTASSQQKGIQCDGWEHFA